MDNQYIKTNRAFTGFRRYAWLFTVMVAFGGLLEPKLGLLVIFIMAGLIITAFFEGRYWCGNICPHGSLFDIIILPISRNVKTIIRGQMMMIAANRLIGRHPVLSGGRGC